MINWFNDNTSPYGKGSLFFPPSIALDAIYATT